MGGKANFAHTKFALKYVEPKVRHGKAAATCKMWKQVICKPRREAKIRAWQQSFGKTRSMSHAKGSVHRFLECSVSKVIKCEKVCLAQKKNLGIHPRVKQAFCGVGGSEVVASDKGLKAELGKTMKHREGIWCCYNRCQ